ncbi:hypothetical protein [Paenibacillus sp. HJGM_3]|uniref:hypothetical protein n=1 Tax=Paenibacillus sp. HJGM_3 TaxID=3379816 RepID=UPI00385E02E2
MGLVDIGGIEPKFFATSAIFILLILSLLSMGILRTFQQRVRPAVVFFVLSAASLVLFIWIINAWLL